MDNLESNPSSTPAPSPTPADPLQEQLESLRHMVTSMLVLVIVLSGTINIYLWRQVKYARADLNAFRPQAAQFLGDYERVSQPALRDFTSKLIDFGKSGKADETFNSLLRKYGVIGTNAPAVPATSAPPAAPAKAPGK